MNIFESFLVELLQGHIILDGNVVEVRRTPLPSAILPCITLSVVGDTTEYTYRCYDEKEKQYAHRQSSITINSWCNTEEQREAINRQIMQCFSKCINHNYMYCSNYDASSKECTYLDIRCKALTVVDGRTAKYQCPLPEDYTYQCLMDKYGLCEETLIIEPPFYSDEINEHPPILHSIFKAECYYDELIFDEGSKSTGGGIGNDITIRN